MQPVVFFSSHLPDSWYLTSGSALQVQMQETPGEEETSREKKMESAEDM